MPSFFACNLKIELCDLGKGFDEIGVYELYIRFRGNEVGS